MKNWSIAICACMAMCMGTTLQAESVYKWKDVDGKTMYSQTPPAAGIEYVIVEQRYNQTAHVPASSRTPNLAAANDSSTTDSSSEQNLPEKERMAESNKIKQENCAQVQKNLESLTSRGQVTIKDGDLYRKLSEEERQAMIKKNEQQKVEFCG